MAILSALSTKFVEPSLLDDKDYATLFSSYYYGIHYDRLQVASYLYLFFVRRIIFVMVMQIDIMSVRIALLLVIQGGWTYLLIKRRPYEDDQLNQMEMFNECIFTVILMVVPVYSNLTTKNRDKYDLGWILVSLLCLALLGALGNLLRITIQKIKAKYAKKEKEIEEEPMQSAVATKFRKRVKLRRSRQMQAPTVASTMMDSIKEESSEGEESKN